jgi:hypothetical protein
MYRIDFDVAAVAVAIAANFAGVCVLLHGVTAAPKPFRAWRTVMAAGSVLSLAGLLLGLARMVTNWHPLADDMCMLLVAGGGLVDLVAAAMYLTADPNRECKGQRASWPWPK